MSIEHFDVLIVGAGISGIGAGCHLQKRCPGKSYAILEGRADIGGTWDLFRYPGIRSDSDMYTLGYSFRPWTHAKAIADGPAILEYLRDTAKSYGIEKHIRFGHRVKRAAWSSQDARWTVEAERGSEREPVRFTCNFLFMCSGYYNYAEGYTPQFPGAERFAGRIVHPQKWTEDIDYANKRVVVIGSGATAVTIVPEMAKTAAHVTMLQRSPTYVISRARRGLHRERAAAHVAGEARVLLTRWKNVLLGMMFFQLSRRRPAIIKKLIRNGVRKQLGPDYDVDTHFTPRYNPWDQRLCLVPNGDLFEAIKAGKRRRRHRSDRDVHAAGHRAALGQAARSGPHRHRDRPQSAAARRRAGERRRPRRRAGADAELQGHDVQRRAESRVLVRLHERVVDAEVRPDVRVRLPPAEPHGEARLPAVHAAQRRSVSGRRSRGSISRPATCSARSTLCRSRARSCRGSCTRTTRSTS